MALTKRISPVRKRKSNKPTFQSEIEILKKENNLLRLKLKKTTLALESVANSLYEEYENAPEKTRKAIQEKLQKKVIRFGIKL